MFQPRGEYKLPGTAGGNYFTTCGFRMFLDVIGNSSTIYSGAEVTSAIWPSPSPASKMLPDVFSQLSTPSTITLERSLPGHHHLRHHPYARCEEGIQGGGTRGGERGDEGQAGVRNYEEFLVLMYSTRKLSTAPNQFLYLV